MAKPDIDDGWLKYAHELDTALACADFTRGERIVLREVFAQVFGPAKRKAATLSQTDIGTRFGLDRSNVNRAIQSLVHSRVLVRDSQGAYRFLKDYEQWTKSGQPRLTPAMIQQAKEAPKNALSHKYGSVVNSDHTSINSTLSIQTTHQQEPVVNSDHAVVNSDHGCGQSRPQVVVNSDHTVHSIEHARIETKETLETTTPTAGRSIRDELEDFALEVLGDRFELEHFGGKLSGFLAQGYDPAWIREAIVCANNAAGPGGLAQYANGCLKRWRIRGSPNPEEIGRAGGKARADPLPDYVQPPAGWTLNGKKTKP